MPRGYNYPGLPYERPMGRTALARVRLTIGDEEVALPVTVPKVVAYYPEETRDRKCTVEALAMLADFLPLVPPGEEVETSSSLRAWEGRGVDPTKA